MNCYLSTKNELEERYADHYKLNFEEWKKWQYHPRNQMGSLLRQHTENLLINSFNYLDIHIIGKRILDFGCGYGNILRSLIEWGADPMNRYGVDTLNWRLHFAKKANPAINYILTSGNKIPIAARIMDIICQTTVFSSILDMDEHKLIAINLDRLLMPGGKLVWYDIFKTSENYLQPISLERIKDLFPFYKLIYLRKAHPTYFDRLAKYSPSLCHLLFKLFPSYACQSYYIILEKPCD
jgi:2-polyprenyl-3-methyl-5-hydroxy-6-metoxy-1,4-benzoquinol methylase